MLVCRDGVHGNMAFADKSRSGSLGAHQSRYRGSSKSVACFEINQTRSPINGLLIKLIINGGRIFFFRFLDVEKIFRKSEDF